jgi:hypothetical protein
VVEVETYVSVTGQRGVVVSVARFAWQLATGPLPVLQFQFIVSPRAGNNGVVTVPPLRQYPVPHVGNARVVARY